MNTAPVQHLAATRSAAGPATSEPAARRPDLGATVAAPVACSPSRGGRTTNPTSPEARLIQSSEVVAVLSPIGVTAPPVAESVARELVPLRDKPVVLADARQEATAVAGRRRSQGRRPRTRRLHLPGGPENHEKACPRPCCQPRLEKSRIRPVFRGGPAL